MQRLTKRLISSVVVIAGILVIAYVGVQVYLHINRTRQFVGFVLLDFSGIKKPDDKFRSPLDLLYLYDTMPITIDGFKDEMKKRGDDFWDYMEDKYRDFLTEYGPYAGAGRRTGGATRDRTLGEIHEAVHWRRPSYGGDLPG